MTVTEFPTFIHCSNCGNLVDETKSYCSQCGQKIRPIVEVKENLEDTLLPFLSYYFFSVLLLSVYKLSGLFDETFQSLVIMDGFLTFITIGFAYIGWDRFYKLYHPRNIKFIRLLIVVSMVSLVAYLINFVVDEINLAVFDEVSKVTEIFQDTSYPILYAIIFLCLQPAIFEEMAFRGFLFSQLETLANKKTTLIVTSCLFGIMHFSLIALLWLIPLGYFFGWLRLKYRTLWYSMAAHFCYNLVFVFIEML